MKTNRIGQEEFPLAEHFTTAVVALLLAMVLMPSELVAGTAAPVPAPGAGSSGSGLWLEPGSTVGNDVRQPPAGPGLEPGTDGDVSFPGPQFGFDPVTGYVVRVAYIVPTNRVAQAEAVNSLRNAVRVYRDWYLDQMQRTGFGPKTFRFETEPDGVTPRIYTVMVNATDAALRADIWGATLSAASAAGVPVWASKQVWWLIPEAHLQAADGSISGGTALGASFGSGDDPGVGMLGSDALGRLMPSMLTNNASYGGQVVSTIGPYPLVQSVSFPWFEGNTFSSISSSVLGAGIHELSHGFGLPHDFRNDQNFNGILMGNGLRGIRGALYPERYPADNARIGYGAGLMLAVSRYFNSSGSFTDNTKPALTVSTVGTNTPVNGLLSIAFACSDAGGLHAAFLSLNGDLVGELKLAGLSTNTTFATAYYNPGQTNRFTVTVLDLQGNRQSSETAIVPRTGFNRAPQPFITVSPWSTLVGQTVTLSAAQSTDPDGSVANLKVEWDVNNDGVFDTGPSSMMSLNLLFTEPGDWLIRARVSDLAGAQTVSAPVALRVVPASLNITRVANGVRLAWPASTTGFHLLSSPSLTSADWQPVTEPEVVMGGQFTVTLTDLAGPAFFRLRR